MEKIKILVTGAAGFLGSHLCDQLLSQGYKVVGVDNFFRGKPENLPVHKNFEFCEFDLSRNHVPLREVVRTVCPEYVIHYAAINGTKYFYDMPYDVFVENVEITQNVLKAIETSGWKGIKKILYA